MLARVRRASLLTVFVLMACDPIGESADASEPIDAGTALDAHRSDDAWTALDAWTADASLPDARSFDDAASPTDAESAIDAAADPDAFTAPDAFVPADAFASPDAFATPDAFVPADAFAARADLHVHIEVDNTCRMTVTPREVSVPPGQTLYLDWHNHSRDYPVDVWMSYGGGYTDLAPGATWDEPIGHCSTPFVGDEYADISTACSSFRFLIHCR